MTLTTAQALGRWLTARRGAVLEQALRGGVWLFIGDAFTRVAGLLKIAILGRLLAPGDFGLMAIAMAVLKALEHLSETGFSSAVIHRRDDVRAYLDTLWCTQVGRALATSTLLVTAAPLAGWFFDNPDATPVVRAVALVLLLRGFMNPAVVSLRKELDFQRMVLWRLSAVVVGLVAGVAVALVAPSVWALLASVIASQACETVLSYWALPYRPRLAFDRQRAHELVGFGKWVFWANVLAFIGLYADSLTVGKVLGIGALGFYQMAFDLAMLPANVIGAQVRGVMFPAFARMTDLAEQRRGFLLALGVVSAIVIPVAAGVTLFGDACVTLLLGARWQPAVPSLRLLVWAGSAATVSGLVNSLFQARGRPDLVAKLGLGQIALWAALFYPLVTAHGIEGMATAVTISVVLPVLVRLAVAARMLGLVGQGVAARLRSGVPNEGPPLQGWR